MKREGELQVVAQREHFVLEWIGQVHVPHALKTIGNSGGSPFTPSNIHHKLKKTKTFGLAFSVTSQAG